MRRQPSMFPVAAKTTEDGSIWTQVVLVVVTADDTRGLGSLLTAIRDQPKIDDVIPKTPPTALERVLHEQQLAAYTRVGTLRSCSAVIAATSGAVLELSRLIGLGWPGRSRAKAMLNAFETFFNYPEASRLSATLSEQARGLDATLINTWLEYYRASLREYGRFARSTNHEIGEKVFGEYFDA